MAPGPDLLTEVVPHTGQDLVHDVGEFIFQQFPIGILKSHKKRIALLNLSMWVATHGGTAGGLWQHAPI